MDALLQIYYLAMAVFGWYCWRKVLPANSKENNNSVAEAVQAIQTWPLLLHAKIIVLLT